MNFMDPFSDFILGESSAMAGNECGLYCMCVADRAPVVVEVMAVSKGEFVCCLVGNIALALEPVEVMVVFSQQYPCGSSCG
jgi:hypothetical protein